jgi:CPA1 family monovalent cation:H+ antiporter
MVELELAMLLIGIVAVVVTAARKLGLAYPILLVVVGLGVGLLPGFPQLELDPELVLVVFLPPILFAAAWQTPFRDFRRNKRPIALLSVGLVLFTTVVVGLVASWAIPGLPLAAALTLGAIVAPPDAIAATTIFRRLDVPRRIVTILEGESLVNDATALTAYRVTVAATLTGVFVAGDALLEFAVVVLGGVAVGLAVGVIVAWAWSRLFDPPVEILLSLLIPYAAYLPAEELHVSGVIAVVTAGLYVGRRSPRILGSDARLLGGGVWQILILALNGLAFLLIGLQLPIVLEALGGRTAGELVGLAALVSATVILARIVWVFPATYLPRALVPAIRAADPYPPLANVFVVAWAGMRGAVSLAAALALPLGFPERDLLIFLTFAVILATLVGQGLTLPAILRGLRVSASMDDEVARERTVARRAARDAAMRTLERLADDWPDHRPLIDRMVEDFEHRASHEPLGGGDDAGGGDAGTGGEGEGDAERHEHLAILGSVIAAQREAVIRLRDVGDISDEILRSLERELDLEDLRLQAEA